MSQQYWEVQNNAKVHEGDVELDKNIISQLPAGAKVRSSRGHGASNWNTTARVDVEVDGEPKSFFRKLTVGPKAPAMLQGEYESMLLINQFGFHITTFNGKLAQDNTWTDTWEEFYVRGMRRMLRPLETGGRRIEPVLHGDLWTGNVATQDATGEPLMFDSSAFWGHHEYELATMRPLANDWARDCMESYHAILPKSEPQEDWEGRKALYAVRVIIHDTALYPEVAHFRPTLIEEMRKLVKQFGQGHREDGNDT